MRYVNKKIETLCLYPFMVEFNDKPSIIMRFMLWILGFKKNKEE